MLSYSNRDFDSILQDLIKQIPELTDKWTDHNKSDLGMVLLQTIAGISAMANFYIDKESNETFIGLAKESKNIESILELIGYQKPLRKCAMATQVFLVEDDPEDSIHLNTDLVLPRGFQIYDKDHKQSCFLADELRIRPNEKYKEAIVYQGQLKTKTYKNSVITGYKFYLPTGKYAQEHFRLIIDGEEWELVENAFLELEGGKKYSIHRDAYDSHYILLTNDYEAYIDMTGSFTIEYAITEGEVDIQPLQMFNISNTFKDVYGNKIFDFITTYNKDTFTGGFTEGDTYYERARLQRQLKVMDRLVTLDDYNNFVSSYPGVLDCEISDVSILNSTNPKPYQADIFILCNTLNKMGEQFKNELLEKIKHKQDFRNAIFLKDATKTYVDIEVQFTTKASQYDIPNIENRIRTLILDKFDKKRFKAPIVVDEISSNILRSIPQVYTVDIITPTTDIYPVIGEVLFIRDIYVTGKVFDYGL